MPSTERIADAGDEQLAVALRRRAVDRAGDAEAEEEQAEER